MKWTVPLYVVAREAPLRTCTLTEKGSPTSGKRAAGVSPYVKGLTVTERVDCLAELFQVAFAVMPTLPGCFAWTTTVAWLVDVANRTKAAGLADQSQVALDVRSIPFVSTAEAERVR